MEKGRSKVNAESGTNKANRASSLKSRVSFMTSENKFQFSALCFGEGNGTPLQYPCLENPMDGRAW